MEVQLIKLTKINNEWYFTHDEVNVISPPVFIDANNSAIIGENVKVEAAATEQELLKRIVELNLIYNIIED